MSEYNMSHTGAQLDDAINKVKSGYILPTDNINITANGEYDVTKFAKAEVNVPVPDNYIDTTDATAGDFDIYDGTTAYVNGVKVTGAYKMIGWGGTEPQWNSNSTGCSSSQLVVPCEFDPTGVCVFLNSGTYTTNTIIVAMFLNGAVTYHSRTSSGVTRNQFTSSISNYWYYDSANKRVILNRPNSTYNWSSYNYRVTIFR